MKQKMYAMLDTVAEEFSPIQLAKNDSVAKRQFQHVISKQPEIACEMKLMYLGEFDTEKGVTAFSDPVEVDIFVPAVRAKDLTDLE